MVCGVREFSPDCRVWAFLLRGLKSQLNVWDTKQTLYSGWVRNALPSSTAKQLMSPSSSAHGSSCVCRPSLSQGPEREPGEDFSNHPFCGYFPPLWYLATDSSFHTSLNSSLILFHQNELQLPTCALPPCRQKPGLSVGFILCASFFLRLSLTASCIQFLKVYSCILHSILRFSGANG
jgi:hypothetical protein